MNDALCEFCKDIFEPQSEEDETWSEAYARGYLIDSAEGSIPAFYDEHGSVYEIRQPDDKYGFKMILKKGVHHKSTQDLRNCGETYCRLCAIFWDQYSASHEKVEQSNNGKKDSSLECTVTYKVCVALGILHSRVSLLTNTRNGEEEVISSVDFKPYRES